MKTPDVSKTPQAILSPLTESLSKALAGACRAPWKPGVAADSVGPRPAPNSATAFVLRFTGSWSGEATLVFRTSDLPSLSLKVEGSGEDSGRLADALEAAVKEMGVAIGALLEEHGPMSIQAEASLAPDTAPTTSLELALHADDAPAAVPVWLLCDSNLIASAQATSSKTFTFPEPASTANLDLVLDVALNVTLRFGQRQLALREVLDLTSGSVVELDRQVDEPVELVLDGRVIARGEAVIVDGSYGMRITQVLQTIAP
jgi:flagellar motor switch protein FliN/FliY